MLDLSLYLVLDPDLCGSLEKMLRTARLSVEAGVTVVQLRAPTWKKRRLLDAAKQLKTLLVPFNVPLLINDHLDIALLADADGVHLGQHDLPADEARRILGPDKIIGLSVSNMAQLLTIPNGLDYLGVGPLFPTTTKKDAAPVLGLAAFSDLVAASPCPVVAIGGINATNCTQPLLAGACGVAVVSALCSDHAPGDTAARLREQIDSAKRARGWGGSPA